MLGALITSFAQLVPELTMKNEDERRAAKAAIAGAVGIVSGALGDPVGAVYAGLLVGKELGGLAVDDPGARGLFEGGMDLAAGALTANPLLLALKGGGAAAGGAIGGIAGGASGAATGLSLGSALLSADVKEAAELHRLAGRLGGAALGGGIGALAADPEDRTRAFQLGLQVGMAVGSAAHAGGEALASEAPAGEDAPGVAAEAQGAVAEDPPAAEIAEPLAAMGEAPVDPAEVEVADAPETEVEVADAEAAETGARADQAEVTRTIQRAKADGHQAAKIRSLRNALVELAGEGVGFAAGAVLHATRRSGDPGDLVSAFESGRAIGRALGSAARAGADLAADGPSARAALTAASALGDAALEVVMVKSLDEPRRVAERRAEAGDDEADALARALADRRGRIGRLSGRLAEAVELVDGARAFAGGERARFFSEAREAKDEKPGD